MPDGSVTAHLRTQEKLLRTGGRTSKVLQEVLADLKTGAEIGKTYCICESKNKSVKTTINVNHVVMYNLLDYGGLSHWQDFPSHLLVLALVGSGIRVAPLSKCLDLGKNFRQCVS